jgi:protein-S-isoprenylcysteine O-methyltransferase Ste14
VVAPGFIAGLAPWWISQWEMRTPFFGTRATRYVGIALIVLGAPILLECFGRFALQGFGTPAPIAPPTRLVVTGLYRYVRNPMYVGVCALILGQAFLLGDTRLIEYGLLVWMGFHLWVLAYEEPTLRSSFPDDYSEYCRNVSRWIPRLHPWTK